MSNSPFHIYQEACSKLGKTYVNRMLLKAMQAYVAPQKHVLLETAFDIATLAPWVEDNGWTVQAVLSGLRKKDVVAIRFVICNHLRNVTSLSLSEIANSVGRTDHATVIHGLKQHTDWMQTNAEYRALQASFEKFLKTIK